LNWLNEILKREKGCSRHWAECAATLGRGALGAELRACCQSRLTGADRAALGEEGATGLALLSHGARRACPSARRCGWRRSGAERSWTGSRRIGGGAASRLLTGGVEAQLEDVSAPRRGVAAVGLRMAGAAPVVSGVGAPVACAKEEEEVRATVLSETEDVDVGKLTVRRTAETAWDRHDGLRGGERASVRQNGRSRLRRTALCPRATKLRLGSCAWEGEAVRWRYNRREKKMAPRRSPNSGGRQGGGFVQRLVPAMLSALRRRAASDHDA
jgi:hypothetical protein